MSRTPIIIVAGNAGSGKDTVGVYLKEKFNACTIALADPMKRLAAELFGFDELTLWGPSECRNAEKKLEYLTTGERLTMVTEAFCATMGLDGDASVKLRAWYWSNIDSYNEKGTISARVVLQTLGTEWGRAVSRDMWVKYAQAVAQKLLAGGMVYNRVAGPLPNPGTNYDYVVITDGRFRNEVLGISAINGVSFNIKGTFRAKQVVGIAGHASEKELDGIPSHFYTETLMNDRDIAHLHHIVDDAMAVTFGDIR